MCIRTYRKWITISSPRLNSPCGLISPIDYRFSSKYLSRLSLPSIAHLPAIRLIHKISNGSNFNAVRNVRFAAFSANSSHYSKFIRKKGMLVGFFFIIIILSVDALILGWGEIMREAARKFIRRWWEEK